MFKLNRIFTILQLFLIFLYLFIVLNSIILLPINIILGIICVLFLPGYNLLNLIKPRFKLIDKIGYMTIISLAIENIFMFFWYFFFYSIVTTPQKPGFVFRPIILITSIQFINLFLILLVFLKNYKIRSRKDNNNKDYENNKFNIQIKNIFLKVKTNWKTVFICFCFIFSLIFLCISTAFSNVPNKSFLMIHNDYRQNFTFFYRVPLIFYLFLTTSILCLTYMVFYTKNKFLILISISLFMYCLWILPYIQIGNYFGEDSYFLMEAYNDYLKYGIRPYTKSNRNLYISKEGGFRYSTSIFTVIILTSATGADINFTLWYLYPLIFVFSPIFFYSIFQKFSYKEENNNLDLILLTILAMFTIQFLKLAHSATTMVLGTYIFLILVIEFFDLMHEKEIKSKIVNFLLIVFLYFFLCLSHFEESIYFLLIIVLYCICFLFFEIKKTEVFNISYKKKPIKAFKEQSNHNLVRKSKNNSIVENDYFSQNFLKGTLIMIGVLLGFLLLIFYLIQEFFGNITLYFIKIISEKNNFLISIYNYYENSKVINVHFFKDTFLIRPNIIWMIFLGISIWIMISYLCFFKFYRYLLLIYDVMIIFIKKNFNVIKNISSSKIFQILVFIIFYCIILLIDLLYYSFLQEQGFLLTIELILNYTIIIFHIFLFFKGISYYKINNSKQNYFLISIIASSSIMAFTYVTGNIFITYHLLNSKFLPLFMIFNLIIIQNTYFQHFRDKKKIYLIIFMIFLLFLGTFNSLNKIGWE